jgi:hypothetical protein
MATYLTLPAPACRDTPFRGTARSEVHGAMKYARRGGASVSQHGENEAW